MNTRSIFVLVPQDKVSDPTFRSFGRLAKELDTHGLQVEVRADSAASDDGRAFLLVLQGTPPSWMLDLPPSERASTLSRVVLLGCVRPPLMYDELEKHGVAGGIDRMKLDVWEHRPSNDTGYGITGLRNVVIRVGGKVAPAPFGSERYCTYGSVTATTTTGALAEYLCALPEPAGQGSR